MLISDWSSDVCSSDLLEEAPNPRRRDFINVAAVAFAGVGAGVVVLPLVNQMSPSADVLALSTTEVDLSKIAEGQAVTTSFRSQPLFVRYQIGRASCRDSVCQYV